jgi:hypothetical protein
MTFEPRPFGVPPESEVTLAVDIARDLASTMGHSQVRVEHVALALISDPYVARVLQELGAHVEAVETALDEVLERQETGWLADGDERTFDPVLSHALRRADAWSTGLERRSLLALLLEESPALDAIVRAGVTPAKLRVRQVRHVEPVTDAADAPYRASGPPRTFTLRFIDHGGTTRPALISTARSAGLSRAAATRAAMCARSPNGIEVGLLTEDDARRLARVADETVRRDGIPLHVEAERLTARSSLDASSEAVARWWRGVRTLRFAFLACVGVSSLITIQRVWRAHVTMPADEAALVEPGHHVRIEARALPSAARYVLPEGLPFAADPRKPFRLPHLHSVNAPLMMGKRILVDTPGAWTTVCSYDAPREIAGPRSSRTITTKFSFLESGNGLYRVLIIGGTTHQGRLEGTVRPREAVPWATRGCGPTSQPDFVFDVDPLPDGPTKIFVPICDEKLVINPNCTPELYGIASDGRLEDWPSQAQWSVLEGSVESTEDMRLPVLQNKTNTFPKALRLTRGPNRFIDGAVSRTALGVFVIGAIAWLVARGLRARGRPT